MRYPQLAGYTVLQVPSSVPLATLETLLKGQLAFSAVNSSGSLQYATGLQIGGVLDDLYYYPGKLGVVFHHTNDSEWSDFARDENCDVKLKLWAPTSQGVTLQLFNRSTDTAPASTLPMETTMECGLPAARKRGRTSTICIR